MKVLSIYQNEKMPSSRIRILQMAPWLRQLGITIDTSVYPESWTERRTLMKRSSDYDLVWLQKKLPSALDLIFWKRLKTPIIFDFDDAISFRQTPKKGSYESHSRQKKFVAIVQIASGVTCGNNYLKSLAAPFNSAPTLIYPSAVPVDVPVHNYDELAHRKPIIGWIGGKGNLHSLESIAEMLVQAYTSTPFILRVISDADFHYPGLEVDNVRWSLDSQEQQVATFDIGLMPLDIHSPFDKGKCAYKLLQYMAASVAVIGSNVGMNAEVIKAGINGQLVDDRQCYAAALMAMLDLAPDSLANMGANGRELIIRSYSYQSLAAELKVFFEEVISSSR